MTALMIVAAATVGAEGAAVVLAFVKSRVEQARQRRARAIPATGVETDVQIALMELAERAQRRQHGAR